MIYNLVHIRYFLFATIELTIDHRLIRSNISIILPNFESYLQYVHDCVFCKMYKSNNTYIALFTSKYKLMMTIYNPINDAWNKIDLFMDNDRMNHFGKMIIVDEHLFYVQTTNSCEVYLD